MQAGVICFRRKQPIFVHQTGVIRFQYIFMKLNYLPIGLAHCIIATVSAQSIKSPELPARIPDRPEMLITHTGYTVSYNPTWKIPNWVAYELTAAETQGDEERSDRFVPDPKLPARLSATTDDYKKSGWDRGHMAPAADMKWCDRAMKESFYLSNVCPQNHNLNAGIWKDLEEQVRDLARDKGRIYVVSGPIVDARPVTIGAGRVAVPAAFFKALLQFDKGRWEAIAFVMENKSGRRLLATCALTVDELEKRTGIDFFPALPDNIEKAVESRVDFARWTVKRQAQKR